MADLTKQISDARLNGYSDDEIIGYLGQSHPELAPKIKEAQGFGYQANEIVKHLSGDVLDQPVAWRNGLPYTSTEPWKQPEGSAAARGVGGLWDTTVGGFLGLTKSIAAIAAEGGRMATGGGLMDPNSPGGRAISDLIQSHVDQAQKAQEAWKKGRYSEFFGHGLATVLPLIGPAAAHAGELGVPDDEERPVFDKYGNVVKQGQAPDIARSSGEAIGLVGVPLALRGLQAGNRYVRAGSQAMGADEGLLPRLPLPQGPLVESTLNPVEQKAIDALHEAGVPMRAGVRTGNRFLLTAEGATAAKPLGAFSAAKLRKQTEAGLHRVGSGLMDEVHPEPQTPESAGQAARAGLDSRIEQFGAEADEGYGNAWAGREKKQFNEKRPLRMDPDGSIIEGEVNMPVDVSELQDAAQALYDDLDWSLSRSEQAQSKAANVLEKILKGDRTITAYAAERGLSALKSMARTSNKSGVRDYSQGTAAHLIKGLQERIDAAVAKTGPEAIRGLQEGRAAHANMMDVVDVAEKLREEPVQAFRQATWAHDSGIGFLRRLAFDSPDAMPKIGRALVQQLYDVMTREGGLNRTKEQLSAWRDLGDQTKALLYPDAKVRAALDNFFKGVDMVIDRSNPSGTEIMRQATSTNPWNWLVGAIGAKFLFTERGIKLLTEGLKAPRGSTHRLLIEKELRGMAGEPDWSKADWRDPNGNPPESGPPAGGGQPNPPTDGGKPKSRAQQLWDRMKEDEGSLTLRRSREPIAAVSLKYLMENPLEVPARGSKGTVLTEDGGQMVVENVEPLDGNHHRDGRRGQVQRQKGRGARPG